LLVNENFPAPALQALREAGIDVVAVVETMRGASDEAILAAAREQDRWLVTFDRDYGELVYKSGLPCPPALLYLRQESFPPVHAATLVLRALADPAQTEGFFCTIGDALVRRRPLPVSAR
jgi:predicted nuclease of predicted toxin-antitoxin system